MADSRTDRRLLPEWAPQQALLLVWPHEATDWAGNLAAVEATYAAMVAATSQPIRLVCRDEKHARHIRSLLPEGSENRCRFYAAPYDDTWVRDYGPLGLTDAGRVRLVDFRFNGWGGKYRAECDDRVTRHLHAAGAFGALPLDREDWVLEGGAIETDGAGTILTTARCLLHEGRNGPVSRSRVEDKLRAALGAQRIIWLESGWLAGDDTDGHIDMLARFAGPGTICYQACDDRGDPHFEPLADLAGELAALRTASGKPYRLIPLPLPQPIRDTENRRLPASYANFLILNGEVLLPAYGDPADTVAAQRLADCFPDRRIVTVDVRPLVVQNGSLHCATMQIPADPADPNSP